jgi:hypothetical protein
MQRRQRQDHIPHHQLHRHPEEQSAHDPMLRHEPQSPANPIKNPRRRTSNKVVQHQPKQIYPRPTTRYHPRPQQPSRNHLRNVPPKQNTSLQNIQRPSHKPRHPDRRDCISLSPHLIRSIHSIRLPSRLPPCSRDRFPDRGPLRSPALFRPHTTPSTFPKS